MMRIARFVTVGLATLCCATITLAQNALPVDRIRQGETKQVQIRSQTQQVSDQLGSIIDEFKRNGLDGEDVTVLSAIRSVLNKLGDKEMQKVIDLLQSARSTTDDGASRRNVAGAVAGQKYIVVQMRQLLLEYQRQQALYELSIRLAALAERQHVNLKAAVDLAKLTQGRTGSQFDDSQRASLQVQQADQQTLKDEVLPILTKLEALAREMEGTTKDRLNNALQLAKDGGLKPAMDSAVDDLKAANLFRAAGSEKTVRDQLRELSRQVAPPKDTLSTLRDAAAQLEKSIEKQKQLIDETKTLNKGDYEKQKQTAQELESRQADLVDQADQMRKDLEAVAPEAAHELTQSMDEMQDARADLNERNRDKALQDEQEALNKLETAKNEVQQALAKAEPAKEYEDKLAAAKELQERTRELIKKETELQERTTANARKSQELKNLAPQQGDVENQTRELQKDTFAQVPEAAQPMSDAAAQMDKAERSLAKPENPRTTQEAQSAAISSLQQADEALTRKIDELEKAQEQLASLKEAREKIADLIQDQQQVELETGKSAAKAAAQPKDLAPKQGELAQQTEQVRKDLSNLEKSAAAPLEEAGKNMDQAKGNLEKNNAQGAQSEQRQAVSNLFKAQRAIDERMDALEKQLGVEETNPEALAEAASQIEEMQQDTANAAEQMSGDPTAMQQSLEEQQQDVAQALEQMNAQQPTPAVAKAQQAAAQATKQLNQGQLAQAAQSMGQAQQGMQSAMKDPQHQPNLPELSKKQEELKRLTEQLAAGQPVNPMAEASKSFGETAMDAGELATQEALPSSAAGALQEANQALSQAAAQSAAGNKPAAQAASQAAQAALAKAAASLSMAQAGLSGQMASAQTKTQSPAQKPAPGQDKPAPTPNATQGNNPAPNSPGQRQTASGNGQNGGPRRNEKTAGKFLALPARDRAALTQSQNDKYPEEYGAQVEQYLRNLAEEEK